MESLGCKNRSLTKLQQALLQTAVSGQKERFYFILFFFSEIAYLCPKTACLVSMEWTMAGEIMLA